MRNVLLLIFITIIMALVTSGLMYFLDHILSNLTILIEYTQFIMSPNLEFNEMQYRINMN